MWTFIQSLRYVDNKSSHNLSTAGQISFGHLYQSLQIFYRGKIAVFCCSNTRVAVYQEKLYHGR